VLENPGNIRFKSLIESKLEVYKAAITKAAKSQIISSVYSELTSEGVKFVKKKNQEKVYYEVESATARVTISQTFRDSSSTDGYRSSKYFKRERRGNEAPKRRVLNNSDCETLEPLLPENLLSAPIFPLAFDVEDAESVPCQHKSMECLAPSTGGSVATSDLQMLHILHQASTAAREEVQGEILGFPGELLFERLFAAFGKESESMEENAFEPRPFIEKEDSLHRNTTL
jgi:hypothetical protein